MAFQVFKESEVNKSVLKKAPLKIKSGSKSKHITGWLCIGEKKIIHMRIPNAHSKEFKGGKAGELARKLFLNQPEYKSFIECSMSAVEYEIVLKREYEKEEKLKAEEFKKLEEAKKES
ncbi:hypothetical protein [Fluviicola taffensis]|uniref:Uncharacterized protein n=1 Tax=Fluviicola taffensis (strain DSM 16823 / NCIMB 13979 / RW262) TaxID=755732 RepID=F2I9T8_FLUTR|nr:hypothetical protein [Fluviicola taffensis]AEA43084.1 hypothetical protein Fluta_1087 [Fluviicola taffensis DSM 16823]